ncbi:MAG TPA: IclR family transcriptional regulator [Gemmatimonadales bacterium]|jgi:DNA-binding IclR family transcriptional regulator|nr:IclR family transcriptional regulator [Gemmatimonadales bacterium]
MVHNLNPHFKMTQVEAYSGTQAVRRAVALLKVFSDAKPEWGLTELARAAGLNKTTVYRLLTALASEGLVARNPATEAYRLGPEAIALGARALRSSDLRVVSHEYIDDLARRSDETATIEILVHGEVLIVDEVHSRSWLHASPSVGTRWPAHATSTGKVLLAALPESERKLVLKMPLVAVTRRTTTSMTSLRTDLAKVRSQGYAMAIGELEDGYSAMAAPVSDHEGRVVAAASVGGPSARLPMDRLRELLPVLLETTTRISKRLGYTG